MRVVHLGLVCIRGEDVFFLKKNRKEVKVYFLLSRLVDLVARTVLGGIVWWNLI
jgi:hypothetical protein